MNEQIEGGSVFELNLGGTMNSVLEVRVYQFFIQSFIEYISNWHVYLERIYSLVCFISWSWRKEDVTEFHSFNVTSSSLRLCSRAEDCGHADDLKEKFWALLTDPNISLSGQTDDKASKMDILMSFHMLRNSLKWWHLPWNPLYTVQP